MDSMGPPTAAARAAILGHRGAVLWLTGLPAAGKSTLAFGVEKRLLEQRILAAVIDGDALRAGLSNDLGFTPDDRRENIRRAGELALHLAEAGAIAIAALISPLRAVRASVAERVKTRGLAFAEVFINAPVSVCERRDPKGLYKKARAGQLTGFTGIDSSYEVPLNSDLELRTDLESIEQSLETLTRLALRLARGAA